MLKVLYNLMVLFGAVSCSMAVFAFFLRARLVAKKQSSLKEQVWHLLAKVGYVTTTGLITLALLSTGKLQAYNWRLGAYVGGFVSAAIGFAGMAMQTTQDTARSELNGQPKAVIARQTLAEAADSAKEVIAQAAMEARASVYRAADAAEKKVTAVVDDQERNK